MKLYVFPPAPNPRKVLTYLGEKGLDLPTQMVNLIEGEQKKPEFLAINPAGSLPVLELDDGSHLAESLAIIEYLEELHPEPSMWGDTPEERARNRSLERRCDLGVLIATARLVHSTNSPLGLPPNPEVAKSAQEFREGTLAWLDERLARHPFVAGDRVTVADCTLFGGLAFGEFFGVMVEPSTPNVARWLQDFRARPSVA